MIPTMGAVAVPVRVIPDPAVTEITGVEPDIKAVIIPLPLKLIELGFVIVFAVMTLVRVKETGSVGSTCVTVTP